MDSLKPGDLVQLSKIKDEYKQGQSARLLAEPGSPSAKLADAGTFPSNFVGAVIETKTYVKVFVGTNVGWLPAEEVEPAGS